MSTQNILNELNKVRNYYAQDALQKRFSALICGESGSGKTYLLRSCRRPIHIDSFDPGGTKCLKKWIDSGDIVVDTRWEDENPNAPDKFALWKKATDFRIQTGYFKHFGTYALDSATTWSTSAMYGQTDGAIPNWNKDYTPVKNDMNIYIKKLLSIPCDLFLLGHLDKKEKVLAIDTKTNIRRTEEISIEGAQKDTLGALICRSGDGNLFNVGTGFTDERRKELWEARNLLPGQKAIVKYQHITSGKKVPRFPVFVEIKWNV